MKTNQPIVLEAVGNVPWQKTRTVHVSINKVNVEIGITALWLKNLNEATVRAASVVAVTTAHTWDKVSFYNYDTTVADRRRKNGSDRKANMHSEN